MVDYLNCVDYHKTKERNTCLTCGMFLESSGGSYDNLVSKNPDDRHGRCRRYPKDIGVYGKHWCGEWRARV